jgi:hypothetical protein
LFRCGILTAVNDFDFVHLGCGVVDTNVSERHAVSEDQHDSDLMLLHLLIAFLIRPYGLVQFRINSRNPFTYFIRLLEWVISPSQRLYLHKTHTLPLAGFELNDSNVLAVPRCHCLRR